MTIIPIKEMMMIANAIKSDMSGNASDIQTLTQRVTDLTRATDFWNRLMLWGLIVAAVAAAWIVITTRLTVVRSKQLSVAQGLLESAKDRKLHEDLASKGVDIGNLKLEAASAEQSIGTAKAEAAKATQKAAEANEAAEDERLARTKLEAQIAPRRLTAAQQMAIAKLCLPFRGKRVTVISYAMDSEAAVLATQIIAAFTEGRLQVTNSVASTEPLGGFNLGIHVTGPDIPLVVNIRDSLSLVGDLLVAPENPQGAGGMAIVSNQDAQSDATVLVGVKPIQQ